MSAQLAPLLLPLIGVEPPGTASTGITTLIGWVTWIAISVCVVGVVIAGAMMAIGQRRGEGGEHAARLGWVLAACVVIGSSNALVRALLP
jgi:hypothetical protein